MSTILGHLDDKARYLVWHERDAADHTWFAARLTEDADEPDLAPEFAATPIPERVVPNPHTPSPEARNRALAAIDANLYVRPRYGITDAHRHVAAGLLASLWTLTEGMGISRDDWRSTADLPGHCLMLAGLQIRRAERRDNP